VAGHAELADPARARRRLRTGPLAPPARRFRHRPAHPGLGPLTPAAITASLDEARAFFPRPLSRRTYTAFACGSWLLDPQLCEYLPEDSNIVRFQRRFDLAPYEEPEGLDCDVEVLRFVFRTLTTPLDQLPRRSVLQRAIVDHLKAGRHWQWRRGRFPI
jgi:hypothetical protein